MERRSWHIGALGDFDGSRRSSENPSHRERDGSSEQDREDEAERYRARGEVSGSGWGRDAR